MVPPKLELRNISKEFPGVRALGGVNFDLKPGEVHAICGENGAGKSTLMKILAGVYPVHSFAGEIFMDGSKCQFHSTQDSQKAKIGIVFQELSLVPEMSVAENIFLGREPHWLGMIRTQDLLGRTQELLTQLGLNVSPLTSVKDLSIGQRQLIEIAKALSQSPQILILDEPTSALTEREVEIFFKIISRLKSLGIAVILISHKLDEVFEISDRITVLRDGQTVSSTTVGQTDIPTVIRHMVGREIQQLYPKPNERFGETALEVKDLSLPSPNDSARFRLDKISFSVRKGEIIGLAGLMGSGRTETLRATYGAYKKAKAEIFLAGQVLKRLSPQHVQNSGISFATEDRKKSGLILHESIRTNITLQSLGRFTRFGLVNRSLEHIGAQKMVRDFQIKTSSLETKVQNLSGGNQQKVVLSKCLIETPKVLFLDEPTRGIDVGARAEIYRWIVQLSKQGMAIVLVSSEMPEILGLCHRIYVLSEGRMKGELSRSEATQEKILELATGLFCNPTPRLTGRSKSRQTGESDDSTHIPYPTNSFGSKNLHHGSGSHRDLDRFPNPN